MKQFNFVDLEKTGENLMVKQVVSDQKYALTTKCLDCFNDVIVHSIRLGEEPII